MAVELLRDSDGSIQLIGQLDYDNVIECRRRGEQLLDDSASPVRISLARLERPSSIVVSLLLGWQRHALRQQKPLLFQSPPEALRQIITVCGLDELFAFDG